MSFITLTIHRLVKGEDLNHHGTLYAGRTAEWFVEAGFVAAANLAHPDNIVCLQIHNMFFTKPVRKGDVVCLESKIVHAGNTSLIAHVDMKVNEQYVLDGYITFVHVNQDGKSLKHGIEVTASTPEEAAIQEKARNLRKNCI